MSVIARCFVAVLAGVVFLGAGHAASPSLTERQRALHLLNRLGFGPRPGDVDRVVTIGVDNYIAQQLHPERIDDRVVEAKLQKYPTLRVSERDLLAEFAEMRQMRLERKAQEDA